MIYDTVRLLEFFKTFYDIRDKKMMIKRARIILLRVVTDLVRIVSTRCTVRRFKTLRYNFMAMCLGIHFPNDCDNTSCHIKGTSKKFGAICLL